ncbi:type VII secretion integral membrane protein EccD [Arthrobacter crystallopoietes]|uniref:Type VII secretion integral membrane protein EccD n=1 Tax=Crystallibacter crystallopoietes TaxID=37928 RepID=A0A1H1ESJ6_9MICC|nr:type VII secretion integral membrane protein EccD [Arthrobacter crystallopoietes]AUI49794.1 type VII secretion integral membrane protein EccD [Arthrobacter crystallopoietes]SDQ91727.1 type VII secretion integral membrane protein EccD [Arthrobacter crystallopoietes]
MPLAFTRVTLIGESRHLDLLLPADQPVGTLMPQILDLMADSPREEVAAKVLVQASGEPLADQTTLSDAGVSDGGKLTLFNASDAPPPAVVYDVTDTVVEETESVGGRWDERFRHLMAGAFAALGSWGAVEILLGSFAGGSSWWILLAVAVALLAGSTLFGLPQRRNVGLTLAGTGWLFGLGSVLHLDLGIELKLLVLALLSTVAFAAVGAVLGRSKAMFGAAGTLAALTAIWAACGFFSGDPIRAAAIAGTISIVLLGLTPKIALSVSGLATLDDQRSQGGSIRRADALDSIRAAHRTLALGTVLTALSIATALWILGTDPAEQVWTLPLLAALVLAASLRARSFPLAAERVSLYIATSVGVAALALSALRLLDGSEWLVGLLLLVMALAIGSVLTLNLPAHTAARLRLAGNKIETIAILATVPLILGLFGLFAQLLTSFGS